LGEHFYLASQHIKAIDLWCFKSGIIMLQFIGRDGPDVFIGSLLWISISSCTVTLKSIFVQLLLNGRPYTITKLMTGVGVRKMLKLEDSCPELLLRKIKCYFARLLKTIRWRLDKHKHINLYEKHLPLETPVHQVSGNKRADIIT
jgi:hypothetical protein